MCRKGSKLYSIIARKCPHCHEGEFLVSRNPYDLTRAGDLRPSCSVCHRKFEPEPGFYYGGMYASYALAVAQSVTVYVAVTVLAPASAQSTRLFWVLGALLLTTPVLYAWSKALWANLFIGYKGVQRQPGEDSKWLA
ncbi:MAG: DUF983 domain-containing protein [Flavobacteriales bacterium]|jgi:hypothetical protein|nr:DUF983 domain-containing protein [Flavobacteriales bacterium]